MYVPVKWEEKEARKLQSDWAAKLKVEVETKTPTGIVMVLIPPAGPAIPKPYWLGKYELTQAEWEGVMGYNPSGFKKGNKEVQGLDTSRFPVERVSWYDCLEFCNKLSEKEGLPPYYALKVVKRSAESGIQQAEVKLLGGNGYHLPTEIQWEHGCRAGTTTGFCFGDNEEGLIEYGWFDKNSGMRPHPVGEKKPNAFGLHDMHGNVREWVVETISRDDFSALSSDRAVIPGRGMNRGGAFEYKASVCRSYESRRHGPADRLSFAGFRLARFP
jgi:formylglycine-generating enzyme required for sulfatase activity